jgi:hypothetical protein
MWPEGMIMFLVCGTWLGQVLFQAIEISIIFFRIPTFAPNWEITSQRAVRGFLDALDLLAIHIFTERGNHIRLIVRN